jgi:hypothetical protein
MMMVAIKAISPLTDWLFVSAETFGLDFETPWQQAWQTLAPSLALFKRPSTGILPMELVQLVQFAVTQPHRQEAITYTVDNQPTYQAIKQCYEACLLYKSAQHGASEQSIVLLQLVVKAYLQLQELPSLTSYWEALMPHLLLLEAEITTNHALQMIANKAEELQASTLLANLGKTELSSVFHYNVSQLLLSKVLYHVWGNELDEAHHSLKLLKQAALTYYGETANIYLACWSLACLELAQLYTNLKNTRDLRLLYEDISLACETLHTALPEALEAKGKTAELLLWTYRHQPSSEKPKKIFRELYDLAQQHPHNKTLVMQYLNGAISLSQTYGGDTEFPAALRLWQQAKNFTQQLTQHSNIQHGLMKLGLNVIWCHNGEDHFEEVLAVYAELVGLLHQYPLAKQAVVLQEFCWATVNMSWIHAHRESVTDIILLLEQLAYWQTYAPTLPCFVEAQAALYRNALWAVRKLYRQEATTLASLQERIERRLTSLAPNNTVSSYERLQLGSSVLQLGHYALVTQQWDVVITLQQTLYRVHETYPQELDLAKAYAEYCMLVLEHGNQSTLHSQLDISWKHITALYSLWPEEEALGVFTVLATQYWSDFLVQQKRIPALETALEFVEPIAQTFPNLLKIQLAYGQILTTVIKGFCHAGDAAWEMALATHEKLRILAKKYGAQLALKQCWGQSLQQLIQAWPSHREVSKTLPLVQELLEVAKESGGETWWIPLLASVRAHHCQSFYLQGFPEYGVKELEAVKELLEQYPTQLDVIQAYVTCLSSQCLWLQHAEELHQACVLTKQLLALGLKENLPPSGWEAPLLACLGVFKTLLNTKQWQLSQQLLRQLLHTFTQLQKQANQPSWQQHPRWVQNKVQLFAILWQELTPPQLDARTWYQRLLLQPTVNQLLQGWNISYPSVMATNTDGGVLIAGVTTQYYATEPTWLAQACFQACLKQNLDEAERLYQQRQQVMGNSSEFS